MIIPPETEGLGEAPAPAAEVPLVLDIDGTLLRTDLLFETLSAALGKDLWATVRAVATLHWSPARLKRRLLDIAAPDLASLPLRGEVLELAREAMARGRQVVLTSGADQALVDRLALQLGLPGPHFGSDGRQNLTGTAKAALFVARFGKQGFDYAGDSADDLPVWRAARRIIAVAPGPRLARRVAAIGRPVQEVGTPWTYASFLREIRPHQWLKNLLLLVPLVAAHDLAPERLIAVLMMMVSFSLAAATVYIVNDIFDLGADRAHPEKRFRPIASGALPIKVAALASGALAAVALASAAFVGWQAVALTLAYLVLSFAYSAWLKHRRWIDLAVLAGLYYLRIVTGAVVAGIGISGWLLGFCFAVFFTLAAVKRLTELARRSGATLPGRGYSAADQGRVFGAAYVGCAAAAALYFAYTFSSEAFALYREPTPLRLATLPVAAWLVRMIRLGHDGREDYDPTAFVLHDRPGLVIALAGIALVLLAV